MTWLAVKTFLKKAWTFIKTYWYAPVLLVYTLFLAYFFRRNADNATKVIELSSKRYEEEIRVIKKTHEEELQKRDEIVKKYSNALLLIEEKYKAEEIELGKKKKKRLLEIIEKYYDDNSSLAREISEKFGVDYVERETTE